VREQKGDLWDLQKQNPGSWICITTNGFIKKTGQCVMGRGCAKEAALKYPILPFLLGSHVLMYGNVPSYFHEFKIISFPVKHVRWDPADLELIKGSAVWLLGASLLQPDTLYFLPRPGCGNGQRDWEKEVKPLLLSLEMPDNVVVVSK
jgi:hypothetical protein